MDLKKTFSLQWRLFLPITLLLWSVIGFLVVYMVHHEKQVRRENIEYQLRNINTTIVNSYVKGEDLPELVSFIDTYNNNTFLDELRISVYDDQNQLIAQAGVPLQIEGKNHEVISEVAQVRDSNGIDAVTNIRPALADHELLMINTLQSNDGHIQTIAATPYNSNVTERLKFDDAIWHLVAIMALVSTGIAFYLCRLLSNSVTALRDFATLASQGKVENIEHMKFPSSELGEVSRNIVRIYMDKDKALEKSKHEHEVAMRAVKERELVKRQTSNNINHELKTPVGIIKGYLDTINSDPDMPESLRRSFLEKAQAHADRLTQLLKDVSSITRLEDGTQQVEITEFDFHDLVYSLANDIEVSQQSGSLEFEYKVPFDCMVKGNYTLITNALMNLVRNAANYSKGTRIELNMVDETESTYVFQFKDDGVGVGEEHLSRLFDRFYRVDEGRARKAGGTGLGLPIVKSTFTAIGGDITVSNADPHGLCFTFVLLKAGAPLPENFNPQSPL